MLPARRRSVFSILFVLLSAEATGDNSKYKKFTSDLENVFEYGGPIIAVAVVEDKTLLRTYVPDNIPRMSKQNQDLKMEFLQKDTTLKPKVDLQMALQNTDVLVHDESDEFEGIQLSKKQKSILRKKWRSSCDKQAARTCKKACNKARKRACDEYHCKKSISKSLKKYCKSSCKHYFLGTKSDEKSE